MNRKPKAGIFKNIAGILKKNAIILLRKFVGYIFGRQAPPVTFLQTAGSANCTNCGAELTGPFCSQCGQKKEGKHDFTVGHFLAHTFHVFTHFDSKFFVSLRYLIFKPGFLTEEFIAGHRKKYMNPIEFFLIINVIYFLFISISHKGNTFTTPLYWQVNSPYGKMAERMVSEKIQKLHI